MRNEQKWVPTKYVRHRDGWRGSRDSAVVFNASRLVADRMAPMLASALQSYAHGDLADLGCGRVPCYEMYRDQVDSVTCVDWPGSLHDTPHLDFEADLSQPLTMFEDASFDTVLLTDVLEHLPEPRAALTEMDRILRPGGRLIMTIPFMYWVHEHPHDYFRYTHFTLLRWAEELGYEKLRLQQTGGPIEVLADVTGKLLTLVGLPHVVPAQQWLGAKAGLALRGSKRERLERLFPLGYLAVFGKA